jgi:hypothetical protein
MFSVQDFALCLGQRCGQLLLATKDMYILIFYATSPLMCIVCYCYSTLLCSLEIYTQSSLISRPCRIRRWHLARQHYIELALCSLQLVLTVLSHDKAWNLYKGTAVQPSQVSLITRDREGKRNWKPDVNLLMAPFTYPQTRITSEQTPTA